MSYEGPANPPPGWNPPPAPSPQQPPAGAPGPYGAPPYAPRGFGGPGPAPGPGWAPGYGPGGWPPQKPPRPATPTAGWLMVAGAAVMVLGTFLPWLTFGGESANGWDLRSMGENVDDSYRLGVPYAFLGVVMGGFGIATVAARRVLPVAILAVIFGSFALLGAFSDLLDAFDTADRIGGGVSIGLWVVLIGAAAALAGAIWTLSVRRTWPSPR